MDRVQIYFPKIFETAFNLRSCFHYKHCGLEHCPLFWTDTTNPIFSTCTYKDPFYDGLFGLDILKEKINKREKDCKRLIGKHIIHEEYLIGTTTKWTKFIRDQK